ncbi:hypothetical protein Tco_0021121, partial [Tanacetum coccineum]
EQQQVSDFDSSTIESPLKVDKETVIDWKEKFFHPAGKVDTVKPKHSEKPVKRIVRYMTPRAVVLKNGLKPLNTARPLYTAHPKPTVTCAKPMFNTARHRTVNTARPFANTVRPITVNTSRSFVNTARANGFNGNPQMYDKGFVDSGCSRHMTGNLAYLSNFIEYDGGNVTFGGGAYGGRITSKGILNSNNIDFKDVYFVNELKFNLFSVS